MDKSKKRGTSATVAADPAAASSPAWHGGHSLTASRDRSSQWCDLCTKRLRRFDFLPATEFWRCTACNYCLHKACLQRCSSNPPVTDEAFAPPRACPVHLAPSMLNWTRAHPDPVVHDLTSWSAKCADCGRHLVGCENIRFCSYFGRAYCHLCHWNDTAVVPASLLVTCLARPQPVCRTALGIIRALEASSFVRLDSHEGLAFLHEYLHRNFDTPGGGGISASLHDIINCRQTLLDRLDNCRGCPTLKDSLEANLPDISRRHLLPQSAYQYNLRELSLIANGEADQLMLELSRMHKAVAGHTAVCLDCTPRICPTCLDLRRRVHRFNEAAVHCLGCRSVYHATCRAATDVCRVCLCQNEIRRIHRRAGIVVECQQQQLLLCQTPAVSMVTLGHRNDAQLLSIYEAGRSCREQCSLLQRLLSLAPSCCEPPHPPAPLLQQQPQYHHQQQQPKLSRKLQQSNPEEDAEVENNINKKCSNEQRCGTK